MHINNDLLSLVVNKVLKDMQYDDSANYKNNKAQYLKPKNKADEISINLRL